jgi:hypothetical protein
MVGSTAGHGPLPVGLCRQKNCELLSSDRVAIRPGNAHAECFWERRVIALGEVNRLHCNMIWDEKDNLSMGRLKALFPLLKSA